MLKFSNTNTQRPFIPHISVSEGTTKLFRCVEQRTPGLGLSNGVFRCEVETEKFIKFLLKPTVLRYVTPCSAEIYTDVSEKPVLPSSRSSQW